ncbi:MAG: winged helix-turn-helix domain-containing protein [Acidobacteria bacterium]|nr:winged helix-turn-helix domain-containing protein [Acidobacteriota bacterium]
MSVAPNSIPNQVFRFGGFQLDVQRRELAHDNGLVKLSGKSFETLVFLLTNRSRLVPKDELLAEVWRNRSISDNVVDQALTDIRRALRRHEDGVWVKTVYGEGYAFVGEVVEGNAVPHDQRPTDAGSAIVLEEVEPPLPPATRDLCTGRDNRKLSIGAITGGISILVLGLVLFNSQHKRLELTPGPSQLTSTTRAKLSPVIAKGNRIFFTEIEGGRYHLMQTTNQGAEPSEVATPARNPYACDIAPDGESLLVRDVEGAFDEYGPLWIVPLGKGDARKVPDVTAFDGSWSHAGKQIAAARGGDLLIISTLDLKVIRKISLPGYGWWPRWSTEDGKIRLTIMDAKSLTNAIWEVDLATGNASRLELSSDPRLRNVSAGDWTSDRKHFVFQALNDGTYSIWASPEEGPRRLATAFPLTAGPIGWRGPTLSREREYMYARGQLAKLEVVKYDTASGQYRRFLGGLSAETVAFSSDKEWIAYTSIPGMALWKARANGLEKRRIVPSPWQAALPRWSPDGSKIAAMLRKPGQAWKAFLIDAGDGSMEELVPGGTKEAAPSWSPDGKKIVLGKLFSVEDSDEINLSLVDLLSRKVVLVPGSEHLFHPAWSTDGQHIVAINSRSFRLYLLDVRTQQWRPLTTQRAGFPTWSADGASVVFLDPDSTFPRVYRANIKTAAVDTLAELTDVRPANSSFGRWIGLHPDGSVLAVQDVSIDQIFGFEYRMVKR